MTALTSIPATAAGTAGHEGVTESKMAPAPMQPTPLGGSLAGLGGSESDLMTGSGRYHEGDTAPLLRRARTASPMSVAGGRRSYRNMDSLSLPPDTPKMVGGVGGGVGGGSSGGGGVGGDSGVGGGVGGGSGDDVAAMHSASGSHKRIMLAATGMGKSESLPV